MNLKRADEIQNEADKKLDLKLVDLFRDNGLEYKQHSSNQKKDKGIDFYSHVYDRVDHSQKLFFQIQNKGTDKKVKLLKGPESKKISFQLELRHVRQYYYEILEPLLVILFENNSNSAYWYAIQLDDSLPERISGAANKDSIQIYIPYDNTVNQANFQRFLKDIDQSSQAQHIKRNRLQNTEADYTFIEEAVKDLDVVDKALYAIDLFEGVPVLPPNILSALHPFKGTVNNSFIYSDTLKTDNEAFFDFVASLSREGEDLLCDGIKFGEDAEKKIERLITFLFHNTIEHINWSGKAPKALNRVCVHKLMRSQGCSCERCSYYELDFSRSALMVTNAGSYDSLHDTLRSGYTAYLMGNYKDSISLFKRVYRESRDEGKIIFSTISNYNLLQLKRIIDISYYHADREVLFESLEQETLNTNEAAVKVKEPHLLDIYRWITDDKFIESATRNITSKVEEIDKAYQSDANGRWHKNGYAQELTVDFLRLFHFLEFNLIVYQNYYEFKIVAARFIEGLIALYSLKNEASKRYEKFSWDVLFSLIFHVEYEKALFLLKKYDVKSISVTKPDVVYGHLYQMLENLSQSEGLLAGDRKTQFNSRAEGIFKNILLLIAKIPFGNKKLNVLVGLAVPLLPFFKDRRNTCQSAIFQLVSHKKKIETTHLKAFIFFLNQCGEAYTSAFSFSVKRFCEQSEPQDIQGLLLELLEADELSEESIFAKQDLFESLGYAVTFLPEDVRDRVAAIYTKKLQDNFNPETYYWAAIREIIGLNEEFLLNLASSVPDQTKTAPEYRVSFGNNENYRLDDLINLMYKYGHSFEKVRHLSSYTFKKDYYDWLMGLDDFDYEKFDPYWVLEYQTKYYFDAFKRSKALKKALKRSIKKDFHKGVAKAYFDIY